MRVHDRHGEEFHCWDVPCRSGDVVTPPPVVLCRVETGPDPVQNLDLTRPEFWTRVDKTERDPVVD